MGTPLRVLIVEDSRDDAWLLAEELRRGGYEPVCERVEREEQMETALKNGGPDGGWHVVISDYSMPCFGARAALELLRKTGHEDTPFIVVSGKVGEEEAVALMKAGAQDYVSKDNLARLVPVIGRELREFRVRRDCERADRALRESEERYRAIVEQSREGIYLIEPSTRRIVETNPALQRMLGYPAGELRGMRIHDLVAHPAEEVEANLRATLEDGRRTVGERKYRGRDGTLLDVEVDLGAIRSGGRPMVCAVIRDITGRKKAERRTRDTINMLLALREASRVLGSTLESEEIGTRVLEVMQRVYGLTATVIDRPDGRGRLRVWRSVGLEDLWPKARYAPEAEAARRAAWERAKTGLFELRRPGPGGGRLSGLCLPLLVRDRTIGVLEAYDTGDFSATDTVGVLASLANQAASALENARLYEELAEHKDQLQELVGKLLTAQDEERRRVAYDIHDGLAQTITAVHQHLEAYAARHREGSSGGRDELDLAVGLAGQAVEEARRVIADLRPTVLDDFGLGTAVRRKVESLRRVGWRIEYEEDLGDGRLPDAVETALFRVLHEALTNVRKHARTMRVRVFLRREAGEVRLQVRDWGQGFTPEALGRSRPGEQVGISGMRERTALLGGALDVQTWPGSGTQVTAVVPLPETAGERAANGR